MLRLSICTHCLFSFRDTQLTKLPDVSPVIVLGYNFDRRNSTDKEMENAKSLLQLLFHCIEKARRYRLSREVRAMLTVAKIIKATL